MVGTPGRSGTNTAVPAFQEPRYQDDRYKRTLANILIGTYMATAGR